MARDASTRREGALSADCSDRRAVVVDIYGFHEKLRRWEGLRWSKRSDGLETLGEKRTVNGSSMRCVTSVASSCCGHKHLAGVSHPRVSRRGVFGAAIGVLLHGGAPMRASRGHYGYIRCSFSNHCEDSSRRFQG